MNGFELFGTPEEQLLVVNQAISFFTDIPRYERTSHWDSFH